MITGAHQVDSPQLVPRRRAPGSRLLAAGLPGLFVLAAVLGCHPPRGSETAVPPPSKSTAEIPVHGLLSVAERESYTGSAACVRCHEAEARQLKSAHARTLARVDPAVEGRYFRIPSHLSDPLEELTFRTAVKDGKCVLQAVNGDEVHEAAADYVFGSGSIAHTYLSRNNGVSTQLRLSHYMKGSRWEFTPGLRMGGRANSPTGEVLTPSQDGACFFCHATALVRSRGVLELDRSILGIECEACHGPGQAHVQAAEQKGPDLKIARLTTQRARVSLELCGQCHRAPGEVDMHEPGMAAQLPRLQALALSKSACFQKGGATCISCHDPHGDAASTTRIQYNDRCLSCHSQAKQSVCPVQPKGDCVSCHMPAQDVGMPTSPRFRNHWIKVWPESATASLSAEQKSAKDMEGK